MAKDPLIRQFVDVINEKNRDDYFLTDYKISEIHKGRVEIVLHMQKMERFIKPTITNPIKRPNKSKK